MRPPGRGRSGPPVTRVLGLTTVCCAVFATACATLEADTRRDAVWLQDTGFPDRASWPSVVLHRAGSELSDVSSLTRAVDRVPGIRVTTLRREGEWGIWQEDEDGHPECPLAVYLNGNRVERRDATTPRSLDIVSRMADVDGLEIHLGPEGPVRTADTCGAVLVWSARKLAATDEYFRGRLAGRVVRTGGAEVRAVRIEPSGDEVLLGRDGSFTVRRLLPGSYGLVVEGPEGVLTRVDTRVWAFAESWVELIVEETGQTGTTRPSQESPPPVARTRPAPTPSS